MTIFRPVEPAPERRATPREGPGRGPDKWPIRLSQGEVSKAMWKTPAVPGIFNGNFHNEVQKEVFKIMRGLLVCLGLWWVLYSPVANL